MSVSASVTPISDAACAPKPLAWFDGALIEADSVQAGLTTHAMHYGSGVFEGIRAYATADGGAAVPSGVYVVRLTAPDDLLTTGIEVSVKPAGKKIERLSLLSGGERSLAAVALMVAIFKARPSPFYILDEVEAALDDANLGRLLGVFEQLRASSQLIVITHQKPTMDVADVLYGVSMQGDGISKVISQRMTSLRS